MGLVPSNALIIIENASTQYAMVLVLRTMHIQRFVPPACVDDNVNAAIASSSSVNARCWLPRAAHCRRNHVVCKTTSATSPLLLSWSQSKTRAKGDVSSRVAIGYLISLFRTSSSMSSSGRSLLPLTKPPMAAKNPCTRDQSAGYL